MRTGAFILLISIALTTSCAYLKNVDLLLQPEIQREHYVQTIPFEWRKDLIVVKARLNSDTAEYEFIFDTGAFNSKVESELADALRLPVVTQKKNSTAQGVSRQIDVIRIDSVKLGETTVYNVGAGKLSYDSSSASPCIAGHGIIGANLIKLAHWKIDYDNKLLHFSDTPFDTEDHNIVIPFDRPMLSGTPQINLTIQGKELENVIFDVGYNGGLVLPMALAKHVEDEQSRIILDQSTSGIYGTNRDSLVVKKVNVGIGGFNTEIPVEFSSLNKGLIGNEFLKHFSVIINYDERKIYLSQKREVRVESPRNFWPGIGKDSLWVVNRTTPELPLKLGESLRSVNGKKPTELFDSHCEYVMNMASFMAQENLWVERMDGTVIHIPKIN
jgi:predicted aspartyl protease